MFQEVFNKILVHNAGAAHLTPKSGTNIFFFTNNSQLIQAVVENM